MSQSQPESEITETTSSTEDLHKISLIDHLNPYSRILYDVEGNILTNENDIVLNVYKPEMDDAINKKYVRIFRNSTMSDMCYRYFVTSEHQLQKFNHERQWGSKHPNKAYHVYVDLDCRDHHMYTKMFKRTCEINN